IPGAPTPLSYAVALRFEPVVEARLAWRREAGRLGNLLNLCSALGLATATDGRPATLAIPRGLNLAQGARRVKQLKEAYPDYRTTFVRKALPEAIVEEIRRTARAHYRELVVPARALAGQRYQNAGRDFRAPSEDRQWAKVAAWLKDQTELAAWEELALVLL